MCNHSKSLGEESVQGWSCPADRPPAQTNTHWEVVLGGSVLCPIFRVFCWGIWWSPETVTISPPLQGFLVFWVCALRGEEQGVLRSPTKSLWPPLKDSLLVLNLTVEEGERHPSTLAWLVSRLQNAPGIANSFRQLEVSFFSLSSTLSWTTSLPASSHPGRASGKGMKRFWMTR